MVKLERILWGGLFLLSISVGALADEQSSEKPEDWERRLERLRAMPYIGFSERTIDEGDTGVVLYDPEKTYNGYNFYSTRTSGEAFMMDMDGRVVHQWEYPPPKCSITEYAIMLENGDLVAIKKFMELLRLNWNSEIIWRRKLEAHHEVVQAPDGSFYVIVQERKDYRELKVNFDIIVHLTADGEEIDRWSTYDHLNELKSALDSRSFLDTILDAIQAGRAIKGKTVAWLQRFKHHPRKLDYFHMNTLGVLRSTTLGEQDARFRRGNLLVCLRNINQIAVLEKDSYRVLWAWGEGELEWPHHSTMLPNGKILLFDNGVKRKYSRVVELNPVTGDIVWEYTAEPPEDFYSRTMGSCQRLPNGNTLICESNKGRVFEVTQEGEMVWTWLNPDTRGKRREIVYRMMRLSPVEVDPLLNKRWWE